MDHAEIQTYLNRIDFKQPTMVSAEFLFSLQRHHLFSVPFENLDIHNRITIDPRKAFQKVVINRRGGFCYELNSLFCDLLRSLGFNAVLISGCVSDDTGKFGPEFDHMTILVELEDQFYLVDVGFGEFSLEPLKIVLNESLFDPRGTFRIRQYEDDRLIVEKIVGKRIIPKYHFSLEEREMDDFNGMCHFHQTDPSSPFMKNRLCSLPTPSGRITLTGNRLMITNSDSQIQRTLTTEAEVNSVLKEMFKMSH
jgi:N-hydroxyarylamine O-acetyltransferase